MRVKGSSPNVRRATKGGSMPDGNLDGFSQRCRTSCFLRDNDPSPFLRRIVFDLFQSRLSTRSSIAGKENLPGANGKRAPHAASEFSATSVRRAPGWKSVLDITCILLLLPVWLPLMIL